MPDCATRAWNKCNSRQSIDCLIFGLFGSEENFHVRRTVYFTTNGLPFLRQDKQVAPALPFVEVGVFLAGTAVTEMNTRQLNWTIFVGAFLAFVVLFPLRFEAQPQSTQTDLRGQVIDENAQPVPRVEVVLRYGAGISQTVYTDTVGRFELHAASISQVQLSLSKPGFFRIEDRVLDLAPGATEISLTLNHETEVKEQLEVQSEPVQIDPDTTSHQESLVQHEILNVPVPSSHDLQQNLRTIPQVIADVNGRLHVAGGREGQTEVLLDGFEINDPASGKLYIPGRCRCGESGDD